MEARTRIFWFTRKQNVFTMSHTILLINILKKVTVQSTKWYKQHVQGNRT